MQHTLALAATDIIIIFAQKHSKTRVIGNIGQRKRTVYGQGNRHQQTTEHTDIKQNTLNTFEKGQY